MKNAILKHGNKTAELKFRPATTEELKSLDGKPEGYIAGWASTKDVDHAYHLVQDGAFTQSIKDRGLRGPRGIKLLLDHDWSKLAGVIEVLEYRNGDLWIEAQLNLEVSYVKDRYLMAKMAGPLSFSVGFLLGDDAEVVNRGKHDETLIVKSGDLYEISIVPFPCNEMAQMLSVKNRTLEAATDVAAFESNLVSLGLVRTLEDAKLISSEVRKSHAIFAPVVEDSDEPPMLAKTSLDSALEAVQKMRELLTK